MGTLRLFKEHNIEFEYGECTCARIDCTVDDPIYGEQHEEFVFAQPVSIKCEAARWHNPVWITKWMEKEGRQDKAIAPSSLRDLTDNCATILMLCREGKDWREHAKKTLSFEEEVGRDDFMHEILLTYSQLKHGLRDGHYTYSVE